MKSTEKRIKEFVDYHINGDGECNNVVMVRWAKENCKNDQEKYELAIFFSITYCIESAIVLFRANRSGQLDAKWIKENKGNLVFQSDRKYMAMRNSFEEALNDYYKTHRLYKGFKEKCCNCDIINLKRAIEEVEKWKLYGRFSAFLFVETLCNLTGLKYKNTTIDWKRGNTATSGLLNVYGFDNAANLFDKQKILILPNEQMDKMLEYLKTQLKKSGGSVNVTEIETSLCAYRKFYKASRYNGFYLDRMLEEIIKMKKYYPEISDELYAIRKDCYATNKLGEVSGWNGIRKKLKKYYILTGEINK